MVVDPARRLIRRIILNMPPDLTPAAVIPFRRMLLMPWRWNLWIWVAIIPLILFAYPLSMGPVVYLAEAGYIPDSYNELVNAIYAPMFTVCELTHTDRVLVVYLAWWADLVEED